MLFILFPSDVPPNDPLFNNFLTIMGLPNKMHISEDLTLLTSTDERKHMALVCLGLG